ncbi:MAG: hypothetical protein OXF44_12140 [Anaerolineaceae bacterium]|nr:hypothetical protein [Anaerolineaceae bacterium]
MNARLTGLFQRRLRSLPVFAPSYYFPLLAFASLVALFLLARHTSTHPTVLGRWSSGYSSLLAVLAMWALALAILCVPAWRTRVLRRAVWSGSRRRAWALVGIGAAAMPFLHVLLRQTLLPDRNSLSVISTGLALATVFAVILLFLWRKGATALTATVSIPLVLLVLVAFQLLVTATYLGKVPAFHTFDESLFVGNSMRQFEMPDRFVQVLADRNADTWFDFKGYWVLAGAWMKLTGAGLLQARLFNLVTAWIGIAFMSMSALKLMGQRAAFLTAVCGIVLPLHFVIARSDIWVATACSIAFCCHVYGKDPGATRVRLLNFACGFFALSAIDGHAYGFAFSLMYGLLYLRPLARALRRVGTRHEEKMAIAFVAGCISYLALWICYHIVLPGVNPSSIQGLLHATLNYETSIGAARTGTGFSFTILLEYIQSSLLYNPYSTLLCLAALLFTARNNSTSARMSLMIAGGAGLLILVFLAHFQRYYLVFWLPFTCLWLGTGLSSLDPIPRTFISRTRVRVSFGTVYGLAAFVMLGTLHLDDISGLQHLAHERLESVTRTGQAIDRMLPAEDIEVAGSIVPYLGMPWRLNFGGSCGFAHGDTRYWPLDPPQAVISTPGWDEGCDFLADWLSQQDFRPARCFTGHDLADGVTILFLSPELMPPGDAVDCSPEHLAWLENT